MKSKASLMKKKQQPQIVQNEQLTWWMHTCQPAAQGEWLADQVEQLLMRASYPAANRRTNCRHAVNILQASSGALTAHWGTVSSLTGNGWARTSDTRNPPLVKKATSGAASVSPRHQPWFLFIWITSWNQLSSWKQQQTFQVSRQVAQREEEVFFHSWHRSSPLNP